MSKNAKYAQNVENTKIFNRKTTLECQNNLLFKIKMKKIDLFICKYVEFSNQCESKYNKINFRICLIQSCFSCSTKFYSSISLYQIHGAAK